MPGFFALAAALTLVALACRYVLAPIGRDVEAETEAEWSSRQW